MAKKKSNFKLHHDAEMKAITMKAKKKKKVSIDNKNLVPGVSDPSIVVHIPLDHRVPLENVVDDNTLQMIHEWGEGMEGDDVDNGRNGDNDATSMLPVAAPVVFAPSYIPAIAMTPVNVHDTNVQGANVQGMKINNMKVNGVVNAHGVNGESVIGENVNGRIKVNAKGATNKSNTASSSFPIRNPAMVASNGVPAVTRDGGKKAGHSGGPGSNAGQEVGHGSSMHSKTHWSKGVESNITSVPMVLGKSNVAEAEKSSRPTRHGNSNIAGINVMASLMLLENSNVLDAAKLRVAQGQVLVQAFGGGVLDHGRVLAEKTRGDSNISFVLLELGGAKTISDVAGMDICELPRANIEQSAHSTGDSTTLVANTFNDGWQEVTSRKNKGKAVSKWREGAYGSFFSHQ
ncbi:hypothetical protein K7X08_034107 [Anisodus acutangulus]|uniref:Uncharacterized protein n=1 Tax=Anisodus acutangulus TaxID=402998 RepID=A0A9Q1LXI7_9SOLA|nr:hypothetical protein K7X08_034107 [Anisodus acutangulus]